MGGRKGDEKCKDNRHSSHEDDFDKIERCRLVGESREENDVAVENATPPECGESPREAR